MNTKYSLTRDDIVFEEVVDEEAITAKIPVEKFFQINNDTHSFESEVASSRIILLVAKSDYMTYFGKKVYAIYVSSENQDDWFGKPVKNPKVGIMRWEKSKWIKIYGFTLSLTIQEEP